MGVVIFVFFLVCYLFCFAVTALHDCHMFQLNSYKPGPHLNWLKRTLPGDWLPRHIFVMMSLVISFILESGPVGTAFFLLLQAYWNRPHRAKKPLVLTGRVKRMLATLSAFVILILAVSFIWKTGFYLVSGFALLCSPLLLLLANCVNAPIEKTINARYLREAKAILAGMPGLVVIGVTGSYGKTSVKHFLHRILSAKYNVLMTPGNFNTTLGVVRTIREELRPVHDVFICEMGARGVGQIKEICELVKPKHGVVTAIGPQHLEMFKSVENIVATKFELADALPEDGLAFLNFDSPEIRERPLRGNAVTYRIESGPADYVAADIAVSVEGSSFGVVLANSGKVRFETRLIGAHNVLNILAAIAVADRMGVPAGDIAVAVRRLESVPHRLQLLKRGDGMTIIDDAYNSNAAGAKAALETLALFDGFKILVTPGMVELGEMQDKCNFDFGVQAAEACDAVVLVGARQTKPILFGLEHAGYPADKTHIVDTIEQAFGVVAAIRTDRHKYVLLENDLPDTY